ncbi:MAG TPA: hypothetical protein VFV98_17085 [Vicinamibacterales bacterium]|nr:hypothetical protein [Vicinamibacterales bacterium]
MNLKSIRLYTSGLVTALALIVVACGGDNPTTPSETPGSTTLAAPVPNSPLNSQELNSLRPTLTVTNAVATGTVGTVTYRFEISELNTFPNNSRTLVQDGVPQGTTTTSWTPGTDLIPNFPYFWRARATNGTTTSEYSRQETFKTQNVGFRDGANIYDPMTNGQTVGTQVGGSLVVGKGWIASTLFDAIIYDIPTSPAARFEFDVLGVDPDEPGPYDIGHKFYCMGNGNEWDFWGFRDGAFKASLDKKTGRLFPDESGVLEHIFRIGGDDNRTKTGPNDWDDQKVYHISLEWGNGRVVNKFDDLVIADESYSGSYAPTPHRISLGCQPRGETLRDVYFSNVRITPR